MKFKFQIQNFLSRAAFKSEADWEMIRIFASKRGCRLQTTPHLSENQGIDAAAFTAWFNDGFACGDVVVYGGSHALLGRCTLKHAEIIASEAAGSIFSTRTIVYLSEIKKASEGASKSFLETLSKNGLQLDRKSQVAIPKHIPSPDERVAFYSGDTYGLGVVRNFDPDGGEVELYCYYIYGTGETGHSMHERGVCTAHGFDFSPMTVSEQRRMNRELERLGKRWYDKLRRVEPLTVKARKGDTYWYVNDKLRVVRETERDTSTSQFRYTAGNYFTDRAAADKCRDAFSEILRDRLAGPGA